jgi:hypothetical protein
MREDVDVRRAASIMPGKFGEKLRHTVVVGALDTAQESIILAE